MPLSDGPRVAAGYMADSGLYGSAVQDALETVRDLQWPASVETYSRMRYDPQISATLNAYALPLGAAHWAIDPAGVRPEVAQYAADTWGLPILGQDPKPSGFRRRGVIWDEHLRLALLSLVFGHMPFAYEGELTDGLTRYRLTGLYERMPHTISNIEVGRNGELVSITQYGDDAPIPGNSLLWYVHAKEGANWTGRSMMREAYGPWLLKHDMWRVLGISSRRFGMGVPTVTAPPGATEADLQKAAQLAQQARAGDQSGAGMPDGFKYALTGLMGSTPDTLGFVKYLDAQIAQGVLASVLNLPSSDTGNRALGETLISLLRESWRAVAKELAIPASRLTARLVDINFGQDEPSPSIVCTGLGRPEATAEAVSSLITAGAITADPALERAMRERYDLPEIEEDFEKKPPTEYGLPAPGSPEAPENQGGAVPTQPEEEPANQRAEVVGRVGDLIIVNDQ